MTRHLAASSSLRQLAGVAGKVCRCTDESALPVRAIELSFQYPPGAVTTLRVSLHDQLLFEGDSEGGRWRREFMPPPADADDHWTFRIQSGTFVAADRYGGEDRRTLGVKLESIRLLAPDRAPSWSPGSAFALKSIL